MPPFEKNGWYDGVLLQGRYGFNWWVNGKDTDGNAIWPDIPPSSFAAQGNKNNICIIVPEWKMVLVRLAQDENLDVGQYSGAFKILREGMTISP
jgi:hypothetical protein